MVDPPPRDGGDRRFGAKGDAKTGGGQHRQIVGAVADGKRLLRRNTVFGHQREQRLPLGLARHDRVAYRAGNVSGPQIEPVGDDPIDPELGRDKFGKKHKPARNQRRHRSGGAHRGDQLSRPRRHSNSLGCSAQNTLIHPGEQSDARRQRGGEVDFAIHCAAGDFGDLGPQPEKVGEFVEHLVLDDRRLHIGNEEAFAPPRRRLDQNIDARSADRGAGGLFDRCRVDPVKHEIAGLARRQPDRLGGNPRGAGNRLGQQRELRLGSGIRDQSEDHAHRPSSYSDGRRGHKPAHAPPVLVIAGPTASGKSALALELADSLAGTIINADSSQCYRDLRILTARPDETAEDRVPHRLYGTLDASDRGSAARWRARALDAIAAVTTAGRLPILVGGSGLYLRALQGGLAPVPEIPEEVRREAAELHRALGGVAFRERLARLDMAAARRLYPGDRQRLIRAFEVARATGVPIGTWQRQADPPPPYRFATILLAPQRNRLYAACNARFVDMIEAGATAEAAALAARGLDPELPAMKAVGVPELLAHLRGDMALGEAITAAQRATRRYAKRQMTWFRHQTTPDLVWDEQFSESLLRCSRHFIDRFLLTRPV